MKIFIGILFLAFGICMSVMADNIEKCSSFFEQNQEKLLKEKFAVSDGLVYIVGISKKFGSDESAFEIAEADALEQLIKLKTLHLNNSANKFKSMLIDNWLLNQEFKYKACNRIEITQFTKDKFVYYVAAYKLSDIEFEDKTPVTWERVYSDFKNNPDKRNELLFFEIIPENELPALKDVVENNLTRQYGKNFALMFSGKDVQPLNRKKYEKDKKAFAKYNASTSLRKLIAACDRIPYDPELCNILAEKFQSLQMPRCASVMKQRSEQHDKLKFIQESETANNKNCDFNFFNLL